MKKHVSVVTQYYPPDLAATGQFIESIINEMSSKEKWKFVIHTGTPSYAKIKDNKYCYFNINEKITIKRTFLSNLIPKWMKGRIINSFLFCIYNFIWLILFHDKNQLIIFTTEPPFQTFMVNLLYRIKKIKYIFIIYDLYPETIVNLGLIKKNGLINKFWDKTNQYTYQNAKHIIVLSENMNKIVSRKYKNVFNKSSVISSWEDPNVIYPIRKDTNWFINKYNLSSKYIILYSGNQGKLHDFETILEAAIILKSNRNIVFLFIGDGSQNYYLKHQTKLQKLDNCFFLPYQKKIDLLYTLNSADIALVTIAKNANGIIAPSKLYGHLAAGTPIAAIAPKDSYLSKLVHNNNVGKSFLNGDSKGLADWIVYLSKNKKVCSSISKNSREFLISNASKNKIMQKYKDIINSYI